MVTLSHNPIQTAQTVIFIDGLTRSGKTLLGPIISSYDRVELERLEPSVEWIGGLFYMGKIERDAAISLIQMSVDKQLYESMIGRNTNFRFGDHSSVWKSSRPWPYFRRLFLDEREPLLERMATERPIYQNIIHHQLMNFSLYDQAFGENLRMIEMIRHPVGLIDSWLRKGRGSLLGNDPLINMLCIGYKDKSLPYYAAGWEEAYLAASPLERIVRMISLKWDANQTTYHNLTKSQQRHLFVIPLENFVERPYQYLDPLGEFIGSRPTPKTKVMLKRNNCPRRYDWAAHDEKYSQFKAELGQETITIVDRLIVEYDDLVTQVAL